MGDFVEQYLGTPFSKKVPYLSNKNYKYTSIASATQLGDVKCMSATLYNNGTSIIYIGSDNTVDAAGAGLPLKPGGSIDLDIANLKQIWVKSDSSGTDDLIAIIFSYTLTGV